MADIIELFHPTGIVKATIQLPASKSISNRLLIINKLSGNKYPIENLSGSTDTQNLKRILDEDGDIANVIDAGTSMRFLTALYCVLNQTKIITGTDRMCERPIGELVTALRYIGFSIEYLKKEGFPPIRINHQPELDLKSEVELDASISSQYISALLMIAPVLKNGLTIILKGPWASKPYISMTLRCMGHFGIKNWWREDGILVQPQNYANHKMAVEPDWSAASYWYEIAVLSKSAEINLEGLKQDSMQGDREIQGATKNFGVETVFTSEGVVLKKVSSVKPFSCSRNFRDNPDLAQTEMVMAAANNVNMEVKGIQSLRIKETDRIAAMTKELKKINAKLIEVENGRFILKPNFKMLDNTFETYNDHRMAMAFSPLALIQKIKIKNPSVVNKSYPSFWDDLRKAGFLINRGIESGQ